MALNPIQKLSQQLARLPGIGNKTASRLAYHILDIPEEQAFELANAICDARKSIHPCPICGAYTDKECCSICTDSHRDDSIICVVCDARDVAVMEKIREFHGRYHVLGGVLSPMDGIGPEQIRIRELQERVVKNNTKEIILATNPDIEGEATASYIARLLKPLGVQVSRIAYGIPIGGNLEYIDEVTLTKALEGRRNM